MGDPMDFSGKVVLVTGGGKGVGRGISQRFLQGGAEVVICGRNAPDSLPAHGAHEAVFLPCDVRDLEQLQAHARHHRGALRPPRRAGEQRRRRAPCRSGHGLATLLRIHHPPQPAGAPQPLPAGQPGDAGAATRRRHHQHLQRQRHPPLPRHRRLWRGQGRLAQPHPVAGRGMGTQGAGERGNRRADPHRTGRTALRRCRRHGKGGGGYSPATPGHPGGYRRCLPVPRLAAGQLCERRGYLRAWWRGEAGVSRRRRGELKKADGYRVAQPILRPAT
uniref:Putative short chain dehydrogenase n=1 Tax=Metapseudomonas resinovorans TaxID=53412 RepID=C5NS18_METRE|nr:putative short chain dehydrogenase [Pseudomonas resinovorans]